LKLGRKYGNTFKNPCMGGDDHWKLNKMNVWGYLLKFHP
jgi:hypothetical protein